MRTRSALLTASVLVFSTAFFLSPSAVAQRVEKSTQRTTKAAPTKPTPTKPTPTKTPLTRPRANEGNVPKAPPMRTNPAEPRQAEHFPTGHVNDIPHVNHDQWFGHESPNDPKLHMDKPFAHGRFAHWGSTYRYRVTRINANLHRFWFPGGFYFEVAPEDWPLCVDWCWNCGDDFVVYQDSDHIGWYLLYDVQTGRYVHVQYMGK